MATLQAVKPQDIRFADEIDVDAGFWNARQSINAIKFEQLRHSIQENGLLQSPRLRRLADGTLQVVVGERRIRSILWHLEHKSNVFNRKTRKKEAASKVYKTIDCYIDDDLDNKQALTDNASENLDREDVTPFDLMMHCISLCSVKNSEGKPLYSRSEVASIVGRDESWVSQTMSLCKLSDRAKQMMADGSLPRTNALYLLKINPDCVDAVLDELNRVLKEAADREREEINREIDKLLGKLDDTDLAIATSSSGRLRESAEKAQTLLERKLSEAQDKQQESRERKPRITNDTIQTAADNVTGSRRGKSTCLSHATIRKLRDGLTTQLSAGEAEDLKQEAEIVLHTLNLTLGETEERDPLTLIRRIRGDTEGKGQVGKAA